MTERLDRIAGAPISWGVCEVPAWGYQLSPDRILTEVRDVGLAATELGPEGFLPAQPDAMAKVLGDHHLRAVGGFTPTVLHAAERGVQAVPHPPVGTVIENGYEVERVLTGSSIALCLDTGHLLIGGSEPADVTRQVPTGSRTPTSRDVNGTVAAEVRADRLAYTEAVAQGVYRPLGTGDVDVAVIIVDSLERNGYTGWYTLEQDAILTEEPSDEGPVNDVRTSAGHVRDLLRKWD